MPTGAKQTIRFGPFELDAQCGQLRRNGAGLKLQGQPIQILEILLDKPGELVTRDELRQRLWASDTFVDFDHSLNTAIKKLRQALEDEAETPRYIETLPRRGYRFIGETEERAAKVVEPEVKADPPVTMVISPAVALEPTRRTFRKVVIGIAAFAALALATFGVVVYHETSLPPPRIVATRQLTHTKLRKGGGIATDGSRVYFSEQRAGNKIVLTQVSTAGGEAIDIPVHLADELFVRGISPSGSELLVQDCCPGLNAWIQPLPAGPARRAPIPPGFYPRQWDSDGNFYYVSHDHRELYRASEDGTRRTRLLIPSFVRNVWDPMLSPSGKHLRFNTGGGFKSNIMEAGIDGSNQHPVFPDMKGQTALGGGRPMANCSSSSEEMGVSFRSGRFANPEIVSP